VTGWMAIAVIALAPDARCCSLLPGGPGVFRDERDQPGVEVVWGGHGIGGVAFSDTKSGFRTTITARLCAKESVTLCRNWVYVA